MVSESSGEISIVERVKAILLKPKDEWLTIERESLSSGDIFTRYAMPLAAIGPVCGFLGGQLFGYGFIFVRFRPSFMGSLGAAIATYILSLISLFVVSFIANLLAPKFGGETNSRNAFKLIVYAATAGWVAGVFRLVPGLSFLGILGLYSFYLFYVGAQPLMKIPQEKALGFTAVTVVCVIVLGLVVGSVTSGAGYMLGWRGMGPMMGRASHDDATVSLPGGVTVETGKIEEAARNVETAVKTGNGKAVPPAELQTLLPPSVGNYTRTSVESVAAGPAGSHAEGTYESGDKRFTLSVADMSALGAMASIGAAFGVESNKEDANGYERTTTRNGNFVVEKWRKDEKNGTYGTMVDQRFMIQAEGDADSIDQLKAAVASIDTAKLTALAK